MKTKFLSILLLGLLCSIGNVWGADISDYASGIEENAITNYDKGECGSISVSTNSPRTGSYCLSTVYTGGTGNKRWYPKATFSVPKDSYFHVIGYAKLKSDDATPESTSTQAYADAYVGTAKAGTAVNLTTSWKRITSTSGKASSDKTGATARLYRKHAEKKEVLFDDIVAYVSTSSTIDLTAPGQATSAEATETEITWTKGTDSGTGATGVQETLIWKKKSGEEDLSLNNQGIYSKTSTKGPSVDQNNNWDLVAVIDGDDESYGGEFTSGDVYAIVHRDLAYNYSTPTYVTVEASVPTLTGAWILNAGEVTEVEVMQHSTPAPTVPTFTVGATSGSPVAEDYSIAYSLKDGSDDGIVSFTAGVPSGISTDNAGTATIVATLTTADASKFLTPATNTFEYTVTVSAATEPTITISGSNSIARGGELTLTATAEGTPTPSINWYASNSLGVPSGESLGTTATYDVPSTTVGTYYFVAIANNGVGGDGSHNVVSDVKTVKVVPQSPTITASGNFLTSQDVVIAKADGEDASAAIKYSTDDGANWNSYGSLNVTSTTTVKAKVVQSDLESDIVSATYTKVYTITKGTPTNGTISVTPTSAAAGEEIPLSATASTGYEFTSWVVTNDEDNDEDITATVVAENTLTMPSANVTVNATFSLSNYPITYTAPSNGSYTIKVGSAEAVSANTTANYGQTILLTATPSTGYALTSWGVTKTSGGGSVTVSNNQFTMPAEAVPINPTFAK